MCSQRNGMSVMRRVKSESRIIVCSTSSSLFPSLKNFENSRRSCKRSTITRPSCDCDECLFGLTTSSVDEKLTHVYCSEGDRETDVSRQQMRPALRLWRKLRNVILWINFRSPFINTRWIQLAGHKGNFIPARDGFVWKRHTNNECNALTALMKDILRPYVAEFYGVIDFQGDSFMQLQDLLHDLDDPFIMDIKMGRRTFLEQELQSARSNPGMRSDLYQKMLMQDISAPTPEENKRCAVTKLRYMQWREVTTSTSSYGFRIEAMKNNITHLVNNCRKFSTLPQIKAAIHQFVCGDASTLRKYIARLRAIRATVEISPFFKTNEVIGSSLLFIHDKTGRVSVWMIDFAKTIKLPANVQIDHRSMWMEGNHEDGYFLGLDNLIEVFTMVLNDCGYSNDDTE